MIDMVRQIPAKYLKKILISSGVATYTCPLGTRSAFNELGPKYVIESNHQCNIADVEHGLHKRTRNDDGASVAFFEESI
jgi:hypothetical protein